MSKSSGVSKQRDGGEKAKSAKGPTTGASHGGNADKKASGVSGPMQDGCKKGK